MNIGTIIGYVDRIWSRHSKIIVSIFVIIASILAFWLRMQQYFNVVNSGIGIVYPEAKLDELDTFINYWIVSYLDSHGFLSWGSLTSSNPVTCLFWFPSCRSISTSELPGHIYTIYILYQIVKPLGINLWDLMAIVPPLLSAISVIFVALIVSEITKSSLGSIVAAFSYALLFISRQVAGFTVKYTFGICVAPIAIWLHIKALKSNNLLLYIVSGFFYAYTASVWTGVGLTAIPLYITLLFLPLFIDLSKKESFLKYTMGLGLESIIPPIIMWFIPSYHGGRTILVIAFIVTYAIYFYGAMLQKYFGRKRGLRYYAISIGAVIFVGIIFLGILRIYPGLIDKISHIIPIAGKILLGIGLRPSGVAETVAEYQSLTQLPETMVLLLLLLIFIEIPIAVYQFIKIHNIYVLSLVIWAFLSWFAAYNTSYFIDYADIALVITIGLSTGYLLQFSKPTVTKLGRIVRVKMDFIQIIALMLAISVAIPSLWISYGESSVYKSLYTMITRAEGSAIPTTVWLDTLNYIRRNTSTNSLIISWWDYGYWLSVIGNRSTVADGATINGTRIHILAKFFTENINGSLNYLKELGACRKDEVYVVIFSPIDLYVDINSSTIYFSPTVSPLGFGDMPKYLSAIVYLATGIHASSGNYATLYSDPRGQFSIRGNDWMVIGSILINNYWTTSFIGLNLNSEKVLNATMPRLFLWTAFKILKKLYPTYKVYAVPSIIIYDNQGRLAISLSSAYGGMLTADKVNQTMYSIAYTGLSQPMFLGGSPGSVEIYRYILIAVLRLNTTVLESICI